MLRFLYADLMRVMKKISFWIISVLPICGMSLVLFIQHSHYQSEYSGAQAVSNISLSPETFAIFAGMAILIAVFYNDSKAKAMQNVIGSGVARWKVFLVKMLEVIILSAIMAILNALVGILVIKILGIDASNNQLLSVLNVFLVDALYVVAIIALVSPILFWFQSPVGGIVVFEIIASSVFYILLYLVFSSGPVVDAIGNITPYFATDAMRETITSIVNNETVNISRILVLVWYILIPSIISVILFQRKDLEI